MSWSQDTSSSCTTSSSSSDEGSSSFPGSISCSLPFVPRSKLGEMRIISQGVNGTVWEARHSDWRVSVAVKCIQMHRPMVERHCQKMQALATLGVLTVLILGACGEGCLKGHDHKDTPSPEEGMAACTLYSKASCCHANYTDQLAASPVTVVDNFYWNRCGNFSAPCEDYLKRIHCFYQCSPQASHWMQGNASAAMVHVPMCQSFCDGWFDACRDDLTCVKNWMTDWTFDENGNHCKNECIPFSQMYGNGTDLCLSQWGDSFSVSQSSCQCLELNETDELAFKRILEANSEESGEQAACQRNPQAKEAEQQNAEQQAKDEDD